MSMAELEHMESQSDEQVSTILGKIGRLKDLTTQIGDEIRSSSNLADTMNDGFSVTSQRLKGTMRRMLRMAEKTGVGWRVWLGFFAAVILLFWYVWLF
jgi:blocked-early-in-transport protein 1